MVDAVLDREPVAASAEESPAVQRLDAKLSETPQPAAQLIGPDGERLELPKSVYKLLRQLVRDLARGNAVTVVPYLHELTTQEAADLLNVSRPFLVKLLEKGEIPFRMVGTHRRILFRDLMKYRESRSRSRREALDAMTREAQEMGFYK